MKSIKNAALYVAVIFMSINATSQTTKDIVDVAANSKEHTTLVAAIKAAELVTTLQSTGPFTVFAPTNAAFANLPTGALDNLLKPENKLKLSGILTYHVVSGNMDAKAITEAIKKNGGKVTLKTAAGGYLIASILNGKVILKDEKGDTATVTATDLTATNGVIHVIDRVLMPKD